MSDDVTLSRVVLGTTTACKLMLARLSDMTAILKDQSPLILLRSSPMSSRFRWFCQNPRLLGAIIVF